MSNVFELSFMKKLPKIRKIMRKPSSTKAPEGDETVALLKGQKRTQR
jgi:hypothetical protein